MNNKNDNFPVLYVKSYYNIYIYMSNCCADTEYRR
jgi:hypothetical protein